MFSRFHKVRLLLHPFPEPLQLFLAGVLQNDFALLLRAFQLDLESRCAAQALGQLLVFNRQSDGFRLFLLLGLRVLGGGFELA